MKKTIKRHIGNYSLAKLILALFFIVSMTPPGRAADVASADSAYLAGDYVMAIDLYNQVGAEYGTSAALLYNLGNAYMRNDDLGNAMLCYQRAKKLDPSNKMINTNLKYLAGKIEDANKAEQKGKRKKVTEDTPNFFESVNNSVARDSSSNAWASWAAGFFIVFAGSVALYLFNSNVLMRKAGFFGGIILLGLSMVCLVCAYMGAAEMENREYGIVLSYKAELQTEPNVSSSNKNEGILTRGTKIRIIAEETDAEGSVNWYKVRLNSDYIGWLPAKDIEVI